MINTNDLNSLLKKIDYRIEDDIGFKLVPKTNRQNPNLAIIPGVLALRAIFQGWYISSAILIICCIVWYITSTKSITYFINLHRDPNKVTINKEGLTIHSLDGNQDLFFEKQSLSDLTIESSTFNEIQLLELKTVYNNNHPIQILKCNNTEEAQQIANQIANIIVNIWDS